MINIFQALTIQIKRLSLQLCKLQFVYFKLQSKSNFLLKYRDLYCSQVVLIICLYQTKEELEFYVFCCSFLQKLKALQCQIPSQPGTVPYLYS